MLILILSCNGDPERETTAFEVELAQGIVSAEAPGLAWPGVVGVPNLDDDDEDGEADWSAKSLDDDDDFTTFFVRTGSRAVELTLDGDDVRIYQDGELLLDQDSPSVVVEKEQELQLEAEFRTFLAQATLTLATAAGDEVLELSLLGAPLILNHHLQHAELTMMMQASYGPGMNNNALISTYKEVLGSDRFLRVNPATYDYDVWVQDEIEFATMTSTDGRMDLVMDSIRDGQGQPGAGLDNLAEDEFLGPGWVVATWGEGRATGQDYFGNFEVSPPVTVDGVHYPFGRVYYGSTTFQYRPNLEIQDFLDEQKVQAPFKLDTSWLIIGHVDEYSTTIPDPGSEKGFKLLFADTRLAWSLLEGADPETSLPRYAQAPPYYGHDIATIGAMLDDTALRSVNEDVQDILDAELEKFRLNLGLEDEDIILVPTLFHEEYPGLDAVVAVTPGMVNLIVADDSEGLPTLFVPDPMLRTDIESTAGDPFVAYMEEALPAGVAVVWMDDWFIYHMGMGEVHCGSNVVRTPAGPEWWVDAAHLLESK